MIYGTKVKTHLFSQKIDITTKTLNYIIRW